MSEIPTHIGFILDGNRRWAKLHGLPVYEGHMAGYNALQEILLELLKCNVKYASVYAFSNENWQRNPGEVNKIMQLLIRAFSKDLKMFIENGIRLRVVGRREGLEKNVMKAINSAEAATSEFSKGELLVCFNYSGQFEIVDAVKKLIENGVSSADVTPELISDNLYAPEVPPCDVIVRTSGEQRLSNFMLWRAAYSEFIFLDKNWPDMTKEDVTDILEKYKNRERRIGK